MFQKVLAHWTYDRDPKQALFYSRAFADLKKEIENDGQEFILELLTKRVVDNQHKLTVELFPSTDEANTFARVRKMCTHNAPSCKTRRLILIHSFLLFDCVCVHSKNKPGWITSTTL
jgi:hypothetical protein